MVRDPIRRRSLGISLPAPAGGDTWVTVDPGDFLTLAGASFDAAASDKATPFRFQTSGTHGAPDGGKDAGGYFVLVDAALDYSAYVGVEVELTYTTYGGRQPADAGETPWATAVGLLLAASDSAANLSTGFCAGFKEIGTHVYPLAGKFGQNPTQSTSANDGFSSKTVSAFFPFNDSGVVGASGVANDRGVGALNQGAVAMTALYLGVLAYVEGTHADNDIAWKGCTFRYKLVST